MVKPRPRGSRQNPKSLERGMAAGAGSNAAAGSKTGDDGDAGMFRAAVGDVRPLSPMLSAAHRIVASKARPRGAPRVRPRPAPELDRLPDSGAPGEVIGGADPLSFRRPGVRDQVLRRLRRGLYPIEDELDLHGLNQAAARESLSDFLEFNRNAGRRCVRIVHGKGHRSGARGPTLKIAVNAWLKHHPAVTAFTSARGIDGGTGAVYVMLRS